MNTKQGRLFQKLEIGVASPKQIRQWAERFLPNGEIVGEVTSWETVNYKTLKPEPNGLFCQKIFGPIVDFTCACGKNPTKVQRGFCPKCGVERTHSRVRRYRLGYIKLKQPVAHPLYASHRPSPLALCLNWSTKHFQAVMKAAEFCNLPKTFTVFRAKFESRSFFQNKAKVFASKISGTKTTKLTESFLVPNFEFSDKTQNLAFSSKVEDIEKEKQSQILETAVHLLKEKQIEDSSKNTVFGNAIKTKLTPRLFNTKKESAFPKLVFNNGTGEVRLYGIAYDATWRQVEELQEFLFYLWEQSFSYESGISYYVFTKSIPKWNYREIPKHDQAYPIQTGGFVFQQILSHLPSARLYKELAACDLQLQVYQRLIREEIAKLDLNLFEDRKQFKRLRSKIFQLQQLQLKCRRQMELFRDFEQAKTQPAWMSLSYLPVLPPGLRPITSIRGELIVSDINTLYRKVLIRNKRITGGVNFGVFDTALSGSWLSWCYNLRQVQEAVDELIKTGSVESGKPLKSLLEGLKGKQGRFRQHFLGKRVDYSGRSVIVVGPHLKIHQCGLPKQMAIELFQPFIIQKLRKKGIVFTTTAAKALIAERKPIIWSILGEILKTHPILLNRAPTLHRLGIQAFLPQLVEGKAILLHPLVCPAFNADFDGDQMAVHVPLSAKTRAEALDLLWSRNHLLTPASGQPLLLPTQDMVLGFYYLTCSQEKNVKGLDNLISSRKALLQNQPFLEDTKGKYFGNFREVLSAYDRGFLTLHTSVWVKWSGFVQTFVTEQQARTKESVIETRLDLSGQGETLFLDSCYGWTKKTDFFSASKKFYFVRTTPGRVLMHSCIFEAGNFRNSLSATSKN